jgi:hypothetical protein
VKTFSLSTLLFLFTIIALAILVLVANSELQTKNAELAKYRVILRIFEVVDASKIHAIEIPGFGNRQWRWRIDLPDDRIYRIWIACDNISRDNFPTPSPNTTLVKLPNEEFLMTVGLVKYEGKWGIHFNGTTTDGSSLFDFTNELQASNTTWLDRSGQSGGAAGSSETAIGDPDEPFELLRYRDGLTVSPQFATDGPGPADGVLVWLEKMDRKTNK